MTKRIKILGSYVDGYTMGETIEKVEEIIKSRKPTQHVVVNASKINLMQEDEKLKEIVNSCPLINADGQSIVWASRVLKKPLPERVTGIDLFEKLIEISNEKGYGVYFFGAKEEVVKNVVEIFKEKYLKLKICGYRNGYFTEANEKEIVEDIRNSGADMVFVAFSSPKKEYWINKYLDEMNVPFVMGVGGSFDVISGLTKRAPIWMQKTGLEWFYRFAQEPVRLFKRYFLGNLRFVSLVYKDKFRRKK